MNIVKQALYSFMSKWHKNRNFNIEVRQYLPMYYEGYLVTELPPNIKPTTIERAFAEIDLAMSYVDWSDMTPMRRDFLNLYKLMKRYIRGTACTYHHVSGNNKIYESGSEQTLWWTQLMKHIVTLWN